jgi:hypothetical protein
MRVILAAAVAAFITGPLLAEDRSGQNEPRRSVLAQAPQGATIPAQQTPVISGVPAGAPAQAAGVIERQVEGELLGTDLMGQPLHAASGGVKIGDVVDVLISTDRKLRGVIVALDGQGPQKKRVGIPFEAIQRAPGDQRQVRLVANLDPAALRAAKDFEGLAKEASLDDNQDLTKPGAATGGSVPPTR